VPPYTCRSLAATEEITSIAASQTAGRATRRAIRRRTADPMASPLMKAAPWWQTRRWWG
jgi:hypothetical protein